MSGMRRKAPLLSVPPARCTCAAHDPIKAGGRPSLSCERHAHDSLLSLPLASCICARAECQSLTACSLQAWSLAYP